MKTVYLLICCVILSFVSSSHAQTRPGRDSHTIRPANTFRIVSSTDWTGNDLYILSPKKKGNDSMIQLKIYDMSYSKYYPYKKGAPVSFFTKTNDPETPYTLLFKVAIPPTNKMPLIFVTRTKSKVHSRLFDIHPSTFPYGSYQMVNLTNKGLIAQFGGNRYSVKPNNSKSVRIKQARKGKAVSCKVARSEDGETKLIYSNIMMNKTNKRLLMFFYPDKDRRGRDTVQCKSLVDFAPTM